MEINTPDRWVIVEINSTEYGRIQKVFAGWYGGYGGGDSWKMSSGNLEIKDCGSHFDVPQQSGSLYRCYKQSEGMSGYMQDLFSSWKKNLHPSTIDIISSANA